MALFPLTAFAQTHPNPQLFNPATEHKIDALIAQMTLEEKIGQLNLTGLHLPDPNAPRVVTGPADLARVSTDSASQIAAGRLGSLINVTGVARVNDLQHVAMDRSRLHIPILFGSDVIHGYKTIYPIPLAVAATFDPDLARQLYRMAAEEASSAGLRWVYSPMVDIARDPRWGRVMEGSGEDPYLGAALARAATEGYQGQSLADPTSVAACVKHYAAYGAAEAGRDYAPAELSGTTLRQVYLAPYRAAVEAGAASLMSSFNTVEGVPATASRFLLTQTLRDDWHFDGFVVSDSGAVGELVAHGVAIDRAQAAQRALHAGLDMDMNAQAYPATLDESVKSGKVPVAEIDLAVRRILRVKFALGLFDHPYLDPAKEVTAATPEHRPLARQAAEESFVLLKNDSALLPLPTSRSRTIALIGPFADSQGDMLGAWSIAGNAADVITLRTALQQRVDAQGGKLLYAAGTSFTGPVNTGIDTPDIASAVAAAQQADVVLLALGEPRKMVGEAESRASLDLPGHQMELLQAIAATGKPIVLLVFSGRPLILNWPAEHVPAILQAWHPGVEAGPALVAVLFGDTSPSGHLTMSFPRSVGQEPLYYNELPTGRPTLKADLSRPPTASTKYLSRYIDMSNTPLYPFGFGLTYSTFTFANLKLSRTTLPLAAISSNQPIVHISATLTNTGTRPATEVAQLYMGIAGTSVSQPVRTLRGFYRLTLAPGASTQAAFDLTYNDLAFYNSDYHLAIEPSRYTFWIGADSDANLSATLTVTQ